VARVERDAVSVEHDARFLLVGTMNVEEGDLRPQLLDRFGLGIEVKTPEQPSVRAEIVRRRLAYERDPCAFVQGWQAQEQALGNLIAAARERVATVRLPERELLRIAGACARLGVDGVRGDIVCALAARALAALDGIDEVTEEQVRRAATLALTHRRRRDPLDSRAPSEEDLERALDEAGGDEPPDDPPSGPQPPGPSATDNESSPRESPRPDRHAAPAATAEPPQFDPALPARERSDLPAPALLPLDALALDTAGRGPHGRRARAAGPGAGAIDSRPSGMDSDDVSIVATLRARLAGGDPGHLLEHVRAGREATLVCLVVDASGSMGAQRRLARVKGALLGLLRDAYARRDRVAVVAFRDGGAHLLVAPGAPLEHAAESIRKLPTGGCTPLAAGLDAAVGVIRREALRDSSRRAFALVLTDGRVGDHDGAARVAAARLGRAAASVHVVDTEEGPVRVGLAPVLAAAAGGRLHVLVSPTPRRGAA
jgi:magnesium chelatase subunit D